MLSKNRIFTYIFLFMLFPGQILSCEWLKFTDEFAMLLLFVLVALDLIQNGWTSFKKLRPLWMLLGIGMFYAVYSVTFVHFNTPKYVLVDLVSQIKPFAPFMIVYGLGLELTGKGKQVARYLCMANAAVLLFFWLWGHGNIILPFGHILYYGGILFFSSLVFIYCSLDREGYLSRQNLIIVMVMLSLGLLGTRSKYYGEFLITVALLFFYRPGVFSRMNLKMVFSVSLTLALVVLLAWNKITYYFIEGGSDIVSGGDLEEMSEAFARPLLFYVGGIILFDYFPFGSGLASFASNASATNYSTLYYEYGLNKVWGLSPSYYSFIADAYYPTLCQFGFVGIGLFIYFWYWTLSKVNRLSNELGMEYRYQFIIGIAILVFVLIESLGGTLFIQGVGFQITALLALLCTPYERRD